MEYDDLAGSGFTGCAAFGNSARKYCTALNQTGSGRGSKLQSHIVEANKMLAKSTGNQFTTGNSNVSLGKG